MSRGLPSTSLNRLWRKPARPAVAAVRAICRVCGHTGDHPSYEVAEMMFGLRESFRYFGCPACGCWQIAEVPADLGRHYPANYYSHSIRTRDVPALPAWKSWLKAERLDAALGRRSLVGSLLGRGAGAPELPAAVRGLGLQARSAILDVGCGNGKFLLDLRHAGFTDLTGIDPFMAADADHPSGVRLRKIGTREFTGRFDAIFLSHVLEHIPEQPAAFADLRRLLAPQGKLVIAIPIAGSLAEQRYGADWFQWDAPRHLFLHSRRSIVELAARHGLRLERETHDASEFQFLASEQYRRGIPLRDAKSVAEGDRSGVFSSEERTYCARLSERVNRLKRGDQATFVFSPSV